MGKTERNKPMPQQILNKLPAEQQNLIALATTLSQQEVSACPQAELNMKSAIYQDALSRLFRLHDKCIMLEKQAQSGCSNAQFMLETMSPVTELCLADVVGAAEDFLSNYHPNVHLFSKSA